MKLVLQQSVVYLISYLVNSPCIKNCLFLNHNNKKTFLNKLIGMLSVCYNYYESNCVKYASSSSSSSSSSQKKSRTD
uniref:CSON001399 protein n=1 Tax=Culicoides sonorensis TaxID=179676 RepID=A0A336MMJ1_CULSO